jgi:AbrB family looped-hinge helix DNA binding protein
MSYFVMYRCIAMKIEGIQARVNQNGRIVIPAVIRKGMGLKLGDTVVLSLEDGILRIAPQKTHSRRVQGSRDQLMAPDRVPSEKLIPESREDEQSEADEWLG